MRRLTKAESRLRWAEARGLWNGWDPIGVYSMSDWPPDEYEGYVGPTLRLLESGASIGEIAAYLDSVTGNAMGLEARPDSSREFAAQLRKWFDDNWVGTGV